VAAPKPDDRVFGWKLGDRYLYTLAMTSTVSFGAAPPQFDFDVSGTVRIAPASVTDKAARLYLEISDPSIVSRVPGTQPSFDNVSAQLAATRIFFLVEGGRVTEMDLAPGTSPMVASILREVGVSLQFSRTAPPSPSYSADEYDTTGKYVARYQKGADDLHWVRTKTSYVEILAAASAAPTAPSRVAPKVVESRADLTLEATGRPLSIQAIDRVDLDNAQATLHSSCRVKLTGGPAQRAPNADPDWTALLSPMDRVAAAEPYGVKAPVESLDNARIHGLTFDEALSGLDKIAKQDVADPASPVNGTSSNPDERGRQETEVAETSRLFVGLAALFREQPKTVGLAVAKIRAKSPSSTLLMQAMSSSGSPTAQAALVDLLHGSNDPTFKNVVIAALSRTPTPTDATVRTFEDLLKSDPFGEQGLLGLGTFSRRLRDAGQDAPASRIGDLLVGKLAAAKTDSTLLTALRALTNAGYDAALPKLAPFTSDRRDEIRAAAVRAMQSMRLAEVDGLLAQQMKSDIPAPVVRAALQAAKVRQPSDALTSAVEGVASSAPDPHVRYRAVEVLAEWLPRRPDVRGALDQVARADQEARVRELARSTLQ
jgi:hypothetical protein